MDNVFPVESWLFKPILNSKYRYNFTGSNEGKFHILKKNITYIFLLNLNPLLGPKCSGSNVIVDQRHADSDTRTTTRDTRTITQDTQTTTNLLNIFTIHERKR